MFRVIRSTLRKVSRTIPVKGNGEDTDKYYRCWHCGFICDSDLNSLGGAASRDGVASEDYSVPTYGATPGVDGSGDACLDAPGHFHVAAELDSAGNPKEVVHDYRVTISGGCPLCGSMNWKGDY